MREYVDNDGATKDSESYSYAQYLEDRRIAEEKYFRSLGVPQNNAAEEHDLVNEDEVRKDIFLEAGSDDGWMETYTGKKFYPLNPRAEDIDIIDIAHSLSLQCRYSGHCKFFYSVATHCCILSDYCLGPNKKEALTALLHDASETYFSDIPRPIKYRTKVLKEIEAVLDAVILPKFGLEPVLPGWMKEIDSRILCDERLQVMTTHHNIWSTDELEPLGVTIPLWSPNEAKVQFLERFYKLQ